MVCGSTNFTENEAYRQFNVAEVVEDKNTAAQYLKMFEHYFGVPGREALGDYPGSYSEGS